MIRRLAFTLAFAALAAACGPLVQIGGGGKSPAALLTLRAPPPQPQPQSQPTAIGGAPVRRTVLVEVPGVPGTLQTLRLPVLTGDTRVQYMVAASWAEQPNKLFQHVLADTLSARPGVIAFSAAEFDGRADRRLAGSLRDFELDVRDATHPVARIRYDAVLTGPDRALIATRRFDRTLPVSDQSPQAVADALNAAANALAGEVADWATAS